MGNHSSRCGLLVCLDTSDCYFDCACLFSPGGMLPRAQGEQAKVYFYKTHRGSETGGSSPAWAGRSWLSLGKAGI